MLDRVKLLCMNTHPAPEAIPMGESRHAAGRRGTVDDRRYDAHEETCFDESRQAIYFDGSPRVFYPVEVEEWD